MGELDPALLREVVDGNAAELDGAIARAESAGVLRRIQNEGLARFAHPLFREALVADTPEAERTRLHLHAAAALERAGGERATSRVAQQLLAAGPGGEPARAVEYALRAGAGAERAQASDLAASLYERAAGLLAAAGADGRTSALVWTRLAEARRRSGASDAEVAARRALEAARAAGERVLLAEAALAFAGAMDRHRLPQLDIERALQEALAALGGDEPGLRARLLARLAAERSFAPDRAACAAARAEAMTVARSTSDIATESLVVDTPFAGIWENLPPSERSLVAERCIEHARAIERRGLLLRGRFFRVSELFTRGELTEMRDELTVVEREAAENHDVVSLFKAGLYRATLALADGELERSERLALAANALGQRLALDGAAFLGTQRVMVAIAAGRAESVLDALAAAADTQPGASSRALLAWALAEAGQEARCAALLREILEHDLGGLRRFPMFVANAAVLARAAARAAARDLVPALEEI